MLNLSNYSTIRDILDRNGFMLKKSLGQNFLINPSICPRMADAACDSENIGVLEIGPGIGVLTAELAQNAKKVVSIEIDQKLAPVLKETLTDFNNIEIIFDDIMKMDLRKLLAEKFDGMEVAVCANLPYYITSPIIMNLLESRLPLKNITVMVQKEAAERLCAEMGSRECGAVTAAVRYYSDPSVLFHVSKDSFLPAPKVDSAVIRFDILKNPPVEIQDEKQFFSLIKAAFSMRRKTLLNAVSARLGLPKSQISAAIEAAGIEPNARAEQLTLEQFAALCSKVFD